MELATMRFWENARNIVFLGPPEVGMTYLATAIGMVVVQSCFSMALECDGIGEEKRTLNFVFPFFFLA
jgi:hypothetical protein